MQKMKSEIGYGYVTIKVTRSRINKGLLAIKVKFNGEEFNVYQAIDNFIDKYFTKDVHF